MGDLHQGRHWAPAGRCRCPTALLTQPPADCSRCLQLALRKCTAQASAAGQQAAMTSLLPCRCCGSRLLSALHHAQAGPANSQPAAAGPCTGRHVPGAGPASVPGGAQAVRDVKFLWLWRHQRLPGVWAAACRAPCPCWLDLKTACWPEQRLRLLLSGRVGAVHDILTGSEVTSGLQHARCRVSACRAV